jgi:hypothetical protein
VKNWKAWLVPPVLFPIFLADGHRVRLASRSWLSPFFRAKGAHEIIEQQRTRLRHEPREAYEAWMVASEWQARHRTVGAPIDMSGSPDTARAEWFEYLAAKERLILAYAELPLAA